MLHITHIALISITFLLIALYLYKSALIASHAAYREMRLRLTVDPSAEFIERVPNGGTIFNACAGAAAKMGIYVQSAKSLKALAKVKTVAADGSSASREGYSMTEKTLSEMGIEISDDTASCLVKMKLGHFCSEDDVEFDFVLTKDKIAHILAIVYISRAYVRFTKYAFIVMLFAIALAALMLILGQFTYAAAAIAIWSGTRIMLVRQIELKTTKMTFKSVTKYS